jgi:release factor glutamine methyltransferase
MTIQETLAEETARLRAAGIDTPALDAGLLLAEILHTGKAGLILRGPDPARDVDCGHFRQLLDRRISGEPVAYILGRKEFRGLDFTVTPDVLIPRPDTETLIDAVIQERNTEWDAEGTVLDLCTGSGAIAISLKNEMPELDVWAADISEKALEVAKANAAKLLPAGGIHFFQADLFTPIAESLIQLLLPHYSLIITNPPYVPGATINELAPEVQKEPRMALDGGKDGLDLIRRIIKEAGDHLVPGGRLLIEADPRQMTSISGILGINSYRNIRIYNDLAGLSRVIGGTKIKDGTVDRES